MVAPALSCGTEATWNLSQPLVAWVSPLGHQQPLDCALHSGTSNPMSPSLGTLDCMRVSPPLGTLGCVGLSPSSVPFRGDPGLSPGRVPPACAVQGARPHSRCPNPNKGLRLLLIPRVLLCWQEVPRLSPKGSPCHRGDTDTVTPEATLLESAGPRSLHLQGVNDCLGEFHGGGVAPHVRRAHLQGDGRLGG